MSVVDIFSPNAAEAESIVGPGQPQELVERLLQLGAQLVALRMGEEGVLLARQPLEGAEGPGGMVSGKPGWHACVGSLFRIALQAWKSSIGVFCGQMLGQTG